jgi:hypothetical protein
MEVQKVLGLSLNTRMVGLAIISGKLLIDYHITLKKGSYDDYKREKIIASLQTWCNTYTIINIALAIPYEKQSNSKINGLLESIQAYFRERKVSITTYPPKQLHRFCEENVSKTKKGGMKGLTEIYPELIHVYNKEMRNKNKYYVKLFEAVAVATIESRKRKKKIK